MEIILIIGYVPLIAYVIWQGYLLRQFDKLVDEQQEVIKKLKPFQVLFATLRSGKFLPTAKDNNLIKLIKKRSRNTLNVSGIVYNRTMKKRKKPLGKVAQATRNAHSAELFRSLLLNKHIVATPAHRKGSRKANIQKAIKEYQ